MDLAAVTAAPAPVLVKGAVAAARNAQDLLYDARVLAGAGRTARVCSLAALAVEEAGKAAYLALLTVMPEDLRARAPVGRMLEPADEADRLKRHGFYVDVGRGTEIRKPSEITQTEVIGQLAQAGQVVSQIGELLKPQTPLHLANPPAEAVELSRAAVSAVTEARARTPKAAVDVTANMVSRFRDRVATT